MKNNHTREGGQVVDINEMSEVEFRPEASVLENSVNVANHLLINRLEIGQSILEIGCGADSYLKNNLPMGVKWEGIDVITSDAKRAPCIATKQGSVDNIPFESGKFDYVLSNQSIEHWHEFGVSIQDGLAEIARVLKKGGHAYLNFPIHLHGHQFFVKGDLGKILGTIARDKFSIESITTFIDSSKPLYRGWRLCGFPDYYVIQSKKGQVSSQVIEITLLNLLDSKGERSDLQKDRKIPLRLNFFFQNYRARSWVLLYKLFFELIARFRRGLITS